jgi:hypothetical protein
LVRALAGVLGDAKSAEGDDASIRERIFAELKEQHWAASLIQYNY